MRQYEVTIKATVVKTLTVTAENEDEARGQAHAEFSAAPDGEPEKYSEDVLSVVDEGEVHSYEVPVVYKGQSDFIVSATSPEQAEQIARAMFNNNENPTREVYEQIERIGEIQKL